MIKIWIPENNFINLLFDINVKFVTTDRKKTIDEACFLLAISPNSGHRLIVICGIPIRIEHDETIRTDEIQAASAGFRTEHEDKIAATVAIKTLNYFRSFLDSHRTIESHIIVGTFIAQLFE